MAVPVAALVTDGPARMSGADQNDGLGDAVQEVGQERGVIGSPCQRFGAGTRRCSLRLVQSWMKVCPECVLAKAPCQARWWAGSGVAAAVESVAWAGGETGGVG